MTASLPGGFRECGVHWSVSPFSINKPVLFYILCNPSLFLFRFIVFTIYVAMADNFRSAASFLKINFRQPAIYYSETPRHVSITNSMLYKYGLTPQLYIIPQHKSTPPRILLYSDTIVINHSSKFIETALLPVLLCR